MVCALGCGGGDSLPARLGSLPSDNEPRFAGHSVIGDPVDRVKIRGCRNSAIQPAVDGLPRDLGVRGETGHRFSGSNKPRA